MTDRPETSLNAWKGIQDKIEGLHGRILSAVAGAHGLTDDELEERLRLSHQCVSARTNELRKSGRLIDSGVRRRTRRGRLAAVWVTSPSERQAAQISLI